MIFVYVNKSNTTILSHIYSEVLSFDNTLYVDPHQKVHENLKALIARSQRLCSYSASPVFQLERTL
jgi:hypothetical protein